ncbi:MAG TPA: monovalent cation:proton antiporter-2 (CPA2) family protein [Steroidobacteraceae bacterium]|nr:monovalent cation:proton antiporter-2 (CPA2) family protein [Steroidobacteraceae bacterium]
MSLIAQIAVFLGATVLVIPLFRRLRLSSILGYLAAGVVLGPWGLRVIQDTEGVMHIAEFGVVLLLFVIGLELQPSRLRAMRKAVFGLGLAQVLLTTAVFMAIGIVLGLPVSAALVTAFALSLSSTPLVLQLLAERQQLNTHYGRSSFAILLFQDIAVMPMLAILPMLGGGQQDLSTALLSGLKGLAVLAALVFGGRYALRPVLRIVAETKVSEAFTAVALFVVLGTALLVDAVGLSMALGAFVAGLLLADSEYRHELEADIEPFKGLLLGLFFMSVGMTANLGLLLEQPGRIALFAAGLLLVKFVVLWALAKLTRHSPESARGLAFALPQGGEFGFVLFSLAVTYRVMDPALAEMLVIVVTISMIASPLLISLHTNVIEPRLSKPEQREFDRVESQDSRVIVAGFGRVGQIVGRVLRMRRIPFTALESSVAQVDVVRRFGTKVYYGDASRLEVLQAAGAARAEVFVLATEDVETSVRTAELVRRHFPNLKIMARARNRQHALRLMDIGVKYFIRETYLSSLDLAQHTLEALGLTRADAVESIRRFDVHDRKQLQVQREFRDDEQKLIQSAQLAARELEQLFESDMEPAPAKEPERRAEAS